MRRWIIILIIFVIVGVGAFLYIQSQGGLEVITNPNALDPTPTPLPAVQTAPDIIVEAVVVPARYAALSFKASGIVAEVLVEEGQQVQQGDLIARLENEREVIAVAQADARVRSARARLDELRAGSRPEEIAATQASVDVARAQLAQLLDGARPEDIAAAEAALAAAQANLNETLAGADDAELIAALAELSNTEAALRQAQAAYDQIRWRNDASALPQAADLERATNNHEAAQARYDLVAAGAKENVIAAARAEVQSAQAALDKARAPATASEIAAAEAEVRRAEAELALRQAGTRPETIMAAEADLTEAGTALMQQQVQLADTELRAPFSGSIAALDLQIGEQVAAGGVVVQLADLTDWRVDTDDLTEINVVYVKEGDRVVITVDALPDLELAGTVIRIKPLGENKQGDITYTATVRPDSFDERLRWNMTASVAIRQPLE